MMPSLYKTFLSSSFALIAFAANSVLCRIALGNNSIDPASFTVIRMLSGALMLAVILMLSRHNNHLSMKKVFDMKNKSGWISSLMLFLYALCFSYAYVKLNTASGALILFATVQLVMIGIHFFRGYRFSVQEIVGIVLSSTGFVYLMLPGATQPSISGILLMSMAGIAWAFYTLAGKDSNRPLINTAHNFIRCIPLSLLLLIITLSSASLSLEGVLLAIGSGAIASAIGYAIWYYALSNLSITMAALSQLTVPLIAAMGGMIFMLETPGIQLILAAILILGGITIISLNKSPKV